MAPAAKKPAKKEAEAAAAEPKVPEYLALREESESESESEDEGSGGEEQEPGSEGEDAGGKPTVDAATLASVKKRVAGVPHGGASDRGVVYVGNIPFGFFEDEMRGFFSQFGDVTRLRMSRSKRTGRSRGYGFVEFEHREVAEIVADTMNNYLMFNRVLKCQLLPKDQVHPDTFKNAHRAFRAIDWRKYERQRHNKARTDEQKEKVERRLRSRDQKKREQLAKAGIDYDFPGYGKGETAAAGKKASAKAEGKAEALKAARPKPHTPAKDEDAPQPKRRRAR